MLFEHPLWEELANFEHNPIYSKMVVDLRLHSLFNIPTPTICSATERLGSKRWYLISSNEYRDVEEYCIEVHRSTSKISLLSVEPNADIVSLMEHIRIMQKYLDILWSYSRFRQLLPYDTSIEFLRTTALIHDFSRFVYNGQLRYTDILGELLIDYIFVNFPSEKYLHSIRWLTGEKRPPSLNSFPLILKAIDTLGKAKRDPATFFEKGYEYEGWLNYQITNKRFPLSVPTPRGGTRLVFPKEYARQDKFYTLKGVELIEKITNRPFVEIRDEAIANLSELTFKEYFVT